MAVLGRLLIAGAERVDLSDLLSIDSYVAGDFKYLLKGLVGENTPYILKGFDVINPGDAIGSQSISIRVADSVVMYPGSSAGPFFHGLPEGNNFAQPIVPELRKNATNYVYLTFSTFETANDTRAFWDPDLDGGVGGEFTQDINTESVLKVEVNVSTSSFPDNTIPVCKVVVGPAVITSIQDARDLMFRLGSGGLSPNPFNRFNFPSDPNSSYQRAEPPTTMSSALDPNPFQGADKNIKSLKEWMDVVMTKLAELGGTAYWYEDATLNLVNLFLDALGNTHTSKGQWSHSSGTAGQLTWSEDIQLKNIPDNRDIIIRSGSKTLLDQEVMYIPLVREADFNNGSQSVSWFNGLNFVNGDVGSFENLVKGDWVKKKGDSNSYNVRVEEFYANTNLTGGVTTAALARSIKLSANYSGTTETKLGARTQGVYSSAEVLIADRADGTLETLGGDLHWLAIRSDTIMAVSNITTSTISGDISDGDGSKAKFVSVAHGLVDGDYITISGSSFYDGTYKIEVEDANTFYIATSVTTDEIGVNAFIAIATTTTRSTADGLLLESANHNFADDETIIVANTSSGYDGSHLIKVRSATTFSFAIGSALSTVATGTATLARIHIRSNLGLDELLQGQSIGIGSPDSDNIMSYIGMGSPSQTHPTYNIPLAYNTLQGTSNYNGETDDNLTVRVAKLTAMMADKAQDKTIKILPSGYESITNTTSGLNQLITFQVNTTPPQQLDIVLPGSANNGTVGLTGTLTLAANQVAYIEIDRNASFSYADLSALTVADINNVTIDENIYIIALRLSGTMVWLWDGFPVAVGAPVFIPVEKANRSLNNLTTTSINASLFFDTDLAYDIGSYTERPANIIGDFISATSSIGLRSTSGAPVLTATVLSSPYSGPFWQSPTDFITYDTFGIRGRTNPAGDTHDLVLTTGYAVGGNSGDLFLSTGGADVTRGMMDLNAQAMQVHTVDYISMNSTGNIILNHGSAGGAIFVIGGGTIGTGDIGLTLRSESGSTHGHSYDGIIQSISFNDKVHVAVIAGQDTPTSGVAGDLTLAGGIATNGTNNGGNVYIESGSSSSGDSGSIVLNIGGAPGAMGNISFKNGTEGTADHIWTSTGTSGEGGWKDLSDAGITSSATIANNTVSANVTGFTVNGATYRSFVAEYWVYRTTDSNEVAESGEIRGVYSTVAATWEISVHGIAGDAEVDFDMTAGGQLTYTSSNLAGTSYNGNMKFSFRTKLVV